ncbi:MAG: hypothetical protein KF795_08400 [Labilithrix sp.]|nr:hypothetical protein [Labilithrix sp.]
MPRTVTVLSLVVALTVGACSAVEEPRNDKPAQRPGGSDGAVASDAGPTSAAPPAIEKLAFVRTPSGPRILVAGTDPGARLESVWLDLLDDSGEPAAIDPDGDGVAESGQLEIAREAMDVLGPTFFFEIEGSIGLERFATRVVARAQERNGKMGEPLTAHFAPVAVHARGDACDLRGFDACADGLACADATPAGVAGRCEDLESARARRCASAPVLAIGAKTSGSTGGASLWDPPDGCASASRRGRPEAVFRLHLPKAMPRVTIETLAGTTTFDSVITVLDGCGAAAKALACNDDDPPPISRVKLEDLAAGDYVVVVDSLERKGGAFELLVTPR